MRRNGTGDADLLTTRAVARMHGTYKETDRRIARTGDIPICMVATTDRSFLHEIGDQMRDSVSFAVDRPGLRATSTGV